MTKDEAVNESTLAQAARGYRATLLSQAVRVICKAVSVVVLARLVSPAEHGLFAMAASVFFVLVLFRDLGLGAAAVQARELTAEQLDTLLRAHVWLGFLLALIAAGFGPIAAAFFHESRVAGLLYAMSLGLVLIGLNSWPRILLARSLRFAELNRVETLAAVLGTAGMVGFALAGAGAYAFVAFLLLSEFVALIGAWLACEWRPSATPRWSSLAGLWRTGADLTGYNIITAVLQQVDAVLMGRWFGAAPLGMYNRSAQVLALPVQHVSGPMTQVLMAALSRLGRDAAGFAGHVRETANSVAHLTLPVAAISIAIPDEVVRLVLGANWPDAAPLLRWLALGAVSSYLGSTIYGLCVATNHSRRLVAMAAMTLALTLVALVIGRKHGPAGLAAALALTNIALLAPRLWWGTRGTPVRLRDYGRAFVTPIGLAVAVGLGALAGRSIAVDSSWGMRLLAAITGAGAAAGLLFTAWPALRRDIRRTLRRPRDDSSGSRRLMADETSPARVTDTFVP